MRKVLLGFIAGAGVGAIAGILFAPNKGSETRKKISKRTDDITESVISRVKDAADQVKSTYSGIMGESEEKGKAARKANY